MLFYNCEVISSKRRTARKRMGGNPVSGQKGGFWYEERGEKAAGWRDFGSGRAGRCRAAVERGQAGVFSGHHLFSGHFHLAFWRDDAVSHDAGEGRRANQRQQQQCPRGLCRPVAFEEAKAMEKLRDSSKGRELAAAPGAIAFFAAAAVVLAGFGVSLAL